MIRSFRSKQLKRLFEDGNRGGVQPNVAARIEAVLDVLDAATSLDDVGQLITGLHPLQGNRLGDWSIVITRNWRITFTPVTEETKRGTEFNVFGVDYEDYH